jgi:hypothetical protein
LLAGIPFPTKAAIPFPRWPLKDLYAYANGVLLAWIALGLFLFFGQNVEKWRLWQRPFLGFFLVDGCSYINSLAVV